MSARAGIFNLAQLWFLTEVVDVNFPGWENGKTTVKLVQRCLCTVWRYLILMLTELRQGRGLLAEGWEQRKMSAASKTVFRRYLRAGQQIQLCSYRRTLSAEATHAANQPIHQPLELKAFLTASAWQALASKMFSWRAERGEMSRSLWL